jgi:YidC/Oxa1 family membrane protein insertase
MTDPNIWNQLFIWPILNVFVAIYNGFSAIGLPGSFGFAIIGLTTLIKLITTPFTIASMKSTQKMQALKPEIDKIKAKYKNDAQAQMRETNKLYKEMGANPVAGCLPMLIQMPIIFALYNMLFQIVSTDMSHVMESINKIVYFPLLHLDKPFDPYFFGINLGSKPSDWQTAGIFLLVIPVITAALQFLQTKTMIPKAQEKIVEKAAGDKKVDESDFANIMQKQMLYFFPVMIGFVSYGFPIGLALYWNTFSIFGIIQQRLTGDLTKHDKKSSSKKSS